MMHGYDRIVAHRFGGPEVLELEHVDALPEPGAGEVRVRVEAAGVGYTDTILRRGRYVGYKGGLPLTPGYDMAGIVDALGPGVDGLAVGQRVADMPIHGAYSQYILHPADGLVPVPDGVDPTRAVEVPLMWMTAWQMLTRIAPLAAGATVLVVGASGSVGRALVLLGRHLGLRLIGTASAGNLASVAAAGADPLDYSRPDLVGAIRAVSGGAGVAAAFDAVGGDSWETSWAALAPGGVLVGYGMQDFLEADAPSSEAMRWLGRFAAMKAEGAADGSGRSTVFYDIAERRITHPDEFRADMIALLALIADGTAVPPQPEQLPLARAAEAHRRIAAGGLTSRLVLTP